MTLRIADFFCKLYIGAAETVVKIEGYQWVRFYSHGSRDQLAGREDFMGCPLQGVDNPLVFRYLEGTAHFFTFRSSSAVEQPAVNRLVGGSNPSS